MKLCTIVFLSFLSLESFAYETVYLRSNESRIKTYYVQSDNHPITYIIEEGIRCCGNSQVPQCQQIQLQQNPYDRRSYSILRSAKTIVVGETVFFDNKFYTCLEQ